MPPAPNLARRGIEEEDTRQYIQDILEDIPRSETQIICGDWNARVGTLSPTIDDTKTIRKSQDRITCNRAPWLIEICELYGWNILNGM
jgi:hypothetical protein